MARTSTESVRKLQRRLYQCAKANPERRFHALYDKVTRQDVLEEAWSRVRANRGSGGVDGVTIDYLEQNLEALRVLGQEILRELKEKTYRPRPIRRVYIPKPDGRQRPLGIATIKDRIVQTAVTIVLEGIFEADFQDLSYGFRPKRSAQQAVERVRKILWRGYHWVVDVDIQGYFDAIPQMKLVTLVAERISDGAMLALVKKLLKAPIQEGKQLVSVKSGVPQGGTCSPVLANVYLNLVDRLFVKHRKSGRLPNAEMVRYADDMVLLCRSEGDAQRCLEWLRWLTGRMELTLHPEKTKIVHVRQGFRFLGYDFVQRQSPTSRRLCVYRMPCTKAQKAIRDKVRRWTRANSPADLHEMISQVNRMVNGWVNYFRHGNSTRAFQKLQRFIDRRIRRILQRRHKRRGQGLVRWPDDYLYNRLGLVYIASGRLSWT